MALALNVFQTIPYVAPTGGAVGIYTAPVGYTGVVLLAQAANVGSVTRTVSLSHKRGSTTTEIVKDFLLRQVIQQTFFQVSLFLKLMMFLC